MSDNKMNTGRRKFLKFGLAATIGTVSGAGAGQLVNHFSDYSLDDIDPSNIDISPEQAEFVNDVYRDYQSENNLKQSTLGGLAGGTGVGIGLVLLDEDSDTPDNDTIAPS